MSDIIPLSSNNTQITFQRQEDGYINATALCKNVGREFNSYYRTQTTQAFLKELEAVTQICGTELVQIQQGGEPHLQGTWVHPQVATHLAQWLSAKFAVQVSGWLQDWIMKKQVPQLTERQQVLLMAQNYIKLEAENVALENTVQKQTQEIQVLEYSKATVEKNLEFKEAEVKEKEQVIEKMETLFKQVADKTGCVKFQACARSLNITDTQLRTLLTSNKLRHQSKAMATTYGVDNGFVKMLPEEYIVKLPDGKTRKDKKLTLHITEKGYLKLLQQVGKVVK